MANSGGWYIFLFLFILGVTCQGMSTMGITNHIFPDTQYVGATSSDLESLQSGALESPLLIFVIYSWVIEFMKIIGAGILAVISVAALFHGMGWPTGVVGDAVLTMIQLPANIIVLFWLFELWTGR